MFGRRVFASAGVPRHAWAALHIQSSRQASRILPSLAPLAPLECRRQLSGAVAAVSAWQTTPAVSDALLSDEDLLLSSTTAAVMAWHRGCLSSLATAWCMPLRTIVWGLDNKLQHMSNTH
ncbi:uncharacterized protein TM35_000031270 [Trypanosoma theileri]|uniref:Uncharacterized protein n=1 Tax=Trypanosoma theileri TaxID=67003 RepID=A0A1X0P600_9TRYP|nr:uncharacterized protein TM35_000031270 [Trypanosoma theileri]ORC92374.1 hypothetical protein TM35_000031270 [Trypanosoma theileri]